MKMFMYLMSNDVKWLEKELESEFVPSVGMNIEGLTGEQPIKITSLAYDVVNNFYKMRLSWMSDTPMNADELTQLGWTKK